MKILINYANIKYYNAQKSCSESGMKFGFDKVYQYNINDIDEEFFNKNKTILSNTKGAGYWLWKSYFLLKTMDIVDYGDYVWYNDSGAEFTSHIDNVFEYVDESEDIILFSTKQFKNKSYTKRDCFYYMNCDSEYYYDSYHLQSSSQIYKKSEKSIEFLNEYLKYCQDERIVSDNVNVCGLNDLPENLGHRHDQSILSLLFLKYKDDFNLKLHKDPTQFPRENNTSHLFDDKYGEIINHFRFTKYKD